VGSGEGAIWDWWVLSNVNIHGIVEHWILVGCR
jgi:hypothetical protein